MNMTATPETGPVDAPASMDSVLAEFETGGTAPDDATESAVRELVEQADGGDAEEAPEDSEGETDAPEVETDESEEAPPEEEEQPEDPVYTVKVNGEELQVPLSELQKGYSRTEDYKAKTMALAEERKGLESSISTAYEERLKQATDLFVQTDPILAEANQIDWQALAQQDPATYTQLRAAVDARMHVLGQAQTELQRVATEREQRAAEEYRTGMVETEAAIRASDPAFSDDAKFSAFVKDTVTELTTVGLDADDLRAILSNKTVGPQVLSLVRDAQRYRAQQKARAQLPAKRVVPVSQAKSLKSDASDSSKSPRKRLSPTASRDQRVAHVLTEFFEE